MFRFFSGAECEASAGSLWGDEHRGALRDDEHAVLVARSAFGDRCVGGAEYDESMTKRRITVTIDAELIETACDAVNAGQASSVSAWVNTAMEAKSRHSQRLAAWAEAVADYEAEFGEITEEEMDAQRRRDLDAAADVRARAAA